MLKHTHICITVLYIVYRDSFINVLLISINTVIAERIKEVPGEDLTEYAGVLQWSPSWYKVQTLSVCVQQNHSFHSAWSWRSILPFFPPPHREGSYSGGAECSLPWTGCMWDPLKQWHFREPTESLISHQLTSHLLLSSWPNRTGGLSAEMHCLMLFLCALCVL